MILSFYDKESEIIWLGKFSKKFPKEIRRTARRKLIHIDSAKNIEDLKIPPGDRLHALSVDGQGQCSISINMQYRTCFSWENGNALNVEIFDYHKAELMNIHPGEILLEDFLKPMGITACKLAQSTHIGQKRISEIIHGRRSITAGTALRFSKFFGNSPEFLAINTDPL